MSYDVRVYDLRTERNVYVTPHFQVWELACKDGSPIVIVNMALANLLETIRCHFNAKTTVNSSYRTVAYNARVSGSSTESQHCYGNAADIVVKGIAPKVVADYVEKLMPTTGGIGRYSNFTHVDVRKVKARWNG